MVKKTSGQLYNRLSVLRAERKWSQQQVADLLHVLSFDVYRDVISLLIGLTFIVQGVTITVLKYRI